MHQEALRRALFNKDREMAEAIERLQAEKDAHHTEVRHEEGLSSNHFLRNAHTNSINIFKLCFDIVNAQDLVSCFIRWLVVRMPNSPSPFCPPFHVSLYRCCSSWRSTVTKSTTAGCPPSSRPKKPSTRRSWTNW